MLSYSGCECVSGQHKWITPVSEADSERVCLSECACVRRSVRMCLSRIVALCLCVVDYMSVCESASVLWQCGCVSTSCHV